MNTQLAVISAPVITWLVILVVIFLLAFVRVSPDTAEDAT